MHIRIAHEPGIITKKLRNVVSYMVSINMILLHFKNKLAKVILSFKYLKLYNTNALHLRNEF